MVSDSSFRSTFFPGEVGFSEEKIIGKVELVSTVESIELFEESVNFIIFNANSVEKGFFVVKHGSNISFVEEVKSSRVSLLERLNEESVEVFPFLETDFVIVVSVGSLEKKLNFSETQMVVLEGIQEFVQHVVVIVSHIREFSG